MSAAVDVSILVVSYNTREMTLACLASVYAQTTGVTFEVVVVDNDSTDGSADAVAAAFPQVRLIRPRGNLGFAKANNVAAAHAAGRWVLLLNPDTVILDGAVQRVVRFAESKPDPTLVVAGGRTFFGDGRLNYNSCHGAPTPWSLLCMGLGLSSLFRRSRLFNPESLGAWKRDTQREVDAVTGCFLLMHRTLWDRLGGFDEWFFMYGEDTDLCIRARKLGARCLVCPDATLVHYGGQSEKVRADKMVKLFFAKVQLFRRHWHPWMVGWGVRMLMLWAFSRMWVTRAAERVRRQPPSSSLAWRDVWRRRADFAAALHA